VGDSQLWAQLGKPLHALVDNAKNANTNENGREYLLLILYRVIRPKVRNRRERNPKEFAME
jgi:hypothetical protein